MSDFNTALDAVDTFDLTPRAARPAGGNVLFSTPSTFPSTSEGFGGGFKAGDAVEYGKPSSRISEGMMDMDVSEEDGCDTLFFLPGVSALTTQKQVCCGVISSGQGIRRFCTIVLETGDDTCGTSSHSVKAKVAANSFFVKTKVKGGSGALMTKTLRVTDMRAQDVSYFLKERNSPSDWETQFDKAKFLKYSGGPTMKSDQREVTEDQKPIVPHYMPTPKRSKTTLESDAPPFTPGSWEPLPSMKEAMEGMQVVRPATDDTPGRKAKNVEAIGNNFDVLQKALPELAESSADSLSELREHFEILARAMQDFERRLGMPEGFGVMSSLTSAFDGMRHLHEVGEERNAKFVQYPYEKLIKQLSELDKQVSTLQTVDRWAEEATVLRKMNHQVMSAVEELRNKTVSRLCEFYHKFTTVGAVTPGDLLSKEVSELRSSVVALESGAQGRPHTQVGFDFHGNQQGSTAQLDSILARLAQAERENARLSSELLTLQASPLGQGGVGVQQQAAPSPTAHLELRLAALESAGDLESVTVGLQTFATVQDCETFLYGSVPHSVLDTYAYDMVSLIYRVGRESAASTAVQREHSAMKAGFLTSGQATLFASFQQALPGPFGVSSGTSNATAWPIPALKDHGTWDRQDGLTGMKSEVSAGMLTAQTAIKAAMARDLMNHPLALIVFDVLITTGLLQWMQFATFISERYMTSLHQIEDPKEAWLFSSEIIKGVFSELHKIRAVAADRTSANHNHKDAARSMWVALQTQRLMGEFITLKFTGHPKLSPYSINHLFRHRVSVKMVEAVSAKITKTENDVRGVVALQAKMKAKYPL